jgi:osmotically-inducible protein OsmY
MKREGIWIVALGLTAFSARVSADVTKHHYTDEQIRTMITHELAHHDIEGIQTKVVGGVVTLEGTVASAWDRDEAMNIVSDLDDVTEIMSEIKVKGGGSDLALAKAVGRQIESYVFYTIFDEVQADVHDGIVSLTGRVTQPFKITEIARQVSRVPGVRKVATRLRVLPLSTSDEHLRDNLAAEIYRELPELAERPVPPIHVVVENGDVTLEGSVPNEVDKRRTEHITRSTFGVFGVHDELKVSQAAG